MASRPSLSPERYRHVAVAALVLLCIIVVTGAAVRLTGSGLGCEDWPRCNEERFIDVSSTHGAIEQVNRLFTGLVALGVVVAVLGSWWRVPRRADLVRWSWSLVAGVVGQVVLGGVVVLTDLHPVANQGHFVLSMILVSSATFLVIRSGSETDASEQPVRGRAIVNGAVVLGIVAVLTGTVVTGAGPHAGDETARRFDVAISTVARIHGSSVIAFLVALLIAAVVVRRDRFAWNRLAHSIEVTIAVGLVQGAVGYVQYFNDIPAGLVIVHIAGATAIMICLTVLFVGANGFRSVRSGDAGPPGIR